MGVTLLEEIEKRIEYYEMLLRVTKQTVARKRILKELKELREWTGSYQILHIRCNKKE